MQHSFENRTHSLAMEEQIDNYDFDNVNKSDKGSQCDFSSTQTGDLRRHLKIHNGEKSNKCNQCEFSSSQTGDLRRHLKVHSGEKPNKCNQCEFASSQAKGLPVAKRNRYFF